MDANKLDLLHHVGYKLNPVCGRCLHSTFQFGLWWGTCGAHRYNHVKHDGMHNMSIHYSGVCSSFELDRNKVVELHAYDAFLT